MDGDFRGAVLNFWFARRRCALCLVWLPPVSLREFCSVQDASIYIFVFLINCPFVSHMAGVGSSACVIAAATEAMWHGRIGTDEF